MIAAVLCVLAVAVGWVGEVARQHRLTAAAEGRTTRHARRGREVYDVVNPPPGSDWWGEPW